MAFLYAIDAPAAQVELVSRSVPELRSDTAMGFSATGIYPDTIHFTHVRPSQLSADGRWIVFTSDAPNLAAGQLDSNLVSDVFLQDRVSGATILVSRSTASAGTAANASSYRPSVSPDGRYVAFLSRGTNLVPGQVDTAPVFGFGEEDVFLFDRNTATLKLISRKAGTTATAADHDSTDPLVGTNGNVVFLSNASDLVPGQSGGLFLYNHSADIVTWVVNSDAYAMSGDGQWVAFLSEATDLVPGQSDTNNAMDVFLYDSVSGGTSLVSHASGSPATAGNGGAPAMVPPSISADGSRVAFSSSASDLVAGVTDTNSSLDVFLYDRTTGTSMLVSRTSGSPTTAGTGWNPAVSSDGAAVAFESGAHDLVPGQTSNGDNLSVFLFDVAAGTMMLASRASDSPVHEANALSSAPLVGDGGASVLFQSRATDLVAGQTDDVGSEDLFIYHRASGIVTLVNHTAGSTVTPAPVPAGGEAHFNFFLLSGDGRWAAFTSAATDLEAGLRDRNGNIDVFRYDRLDGTNDAVSVHDPSLPSISADGESALASLSADGRFVAFLSNAPDLIAGLNDLNGPGDDLFLFDRTTEEIVLVSHTPASSTSTGDGTVVAATISDDGRFIVFSSSSTDLVPGQSDGNGMLDVFLFERATGSLTLVSQAAGSPGVAANAGSGDPTISEDGRFIAYTSFATDLVSGQSDGSPAEDVFLYDRLGGTTTLVSHASGSPTATANGPSGAPALSPDGRFLAFESQATDLIGGLSDTNGDKDVFLYDRISGTTTLVSHASGLPGSTADQASMAPVLNENGRFVVFNSGAGNLVPGQAGGQFSVFLYDRTTGSSTLVSHASDSFVTTANSSSSSRSIDDNGDFVAFNSRANNLVPGQIDGFPDPLYGIDSFLYDRSSGKVTLVSHTDSSPVTASNGVVAGPEISGDGTRIVFGSFTGVFIYSRLTGVLTLVSSPTAPSGDPRAPGFTPPVGPLISQDGRFIAFSGTASNLVAQDFNRQQDVFLWGDPAQGRDFFTLQPCRVLDTREPGQGPALASGSLARFTVQGVCAIPATARVIAANVTVTQSTGLGHLTIFPGDYLMPPSTSTINFGAGQTRANNAVLPLSADGTLGLAAFVQGGGTVHVIVDVVGYFE